MPLQSSFLKISHFHDVPTVVARPQTVVVHVSLLPREPRLQAHVVKYVLGMGPHFLKCL